MTQYIQHDLRLTLFQQAMTYQQILLRPKTSILERINAGRTLQTIAAALGTVDNIIEDGWVASYKDVLNCMGVDVFKLAGKTVKDVLLSQVSEDPEIDAFVKGLIASMSLIHGAGTWTFKAEKTKF